MKVSAGMRFGRLVAAHLSGRSPDGHRVWKCDCDCGASVLRQTNNLQAPGLKSCGCAHSDLSAKHGMRSSPEYSSWQAAKARCCSPDSKDFARYGGRGIQMHGEWAESFEAFYEYMGKRPPGMTLERLDVNGHYEPGNCKWATPSEQARNRRSSIYTDWNGRRAHLCEVADELGITYGAAFMRLKRGKLHASL